MKNLENIGRLARRPWAAARRSAPRGVTLRPGHRALQPVDDHPVGGAQAAGHDPLDADRAGPSSTPVRLHDIVLVDRQHVGAGLVAADHRLRDQQRVGAPAERCADAGEQAGQELVVGVREDAAQLQRAGAGGQRDGGEVELAGVREAVLVGRRPAPGPGRSAGRAADALARSPRMRNSSRSLIVK